ncbi:PIN domain-containing protein [Halarcobacter ebronensis]|uniref:DUF4935 domain-containing protein n=1 Tax=Halarcobacter ebronensis TaxID=1462615 RepID=A0A4Q1AZI3_9BACT|nr:PIN domain-containing protein [Halarcobacter ebronensis]QKF82365.1 DUF4935 domain-containing protein [Halarcobacter ebronensis]RXK07608.1 hypothetical protein CRV07_03865 [Halarcobacter ebronensis]
MKYIFLDTNIFFKNWYLDSKDFEILKHYINTSDNELLVSRLVCEETNNKFNESFVELSHTIEKSITDINNLTKGEISISLENIHDYNISSILEKKFPLIYFDYTDVPHEKIISKIFKKEKPIKNSDIGYRDALIWLSFVNAIKHTKVGVDEYIFISKNHKDFFLKQGDTYSLHHDLQKDLDDENVSVYIDLKSFFDSHHISIPFKELKNDEFHKFQDQYTYLIEEMIDYQIEEYFSNIPYSEIRQAIKKKYSLDTYILSNMFNFRIEIIDGTEDPEIDRVQYLDDNDNMLVDYHLWIRNCMIYFEIPNFYCSFVEDTIYALFQDDKTNETTTYFFSPPDICLELEIFCDVNKEYVSSFEVIEMNLEKYC